MKNKGLNRGNLVKECELDSAFVDLRTLSEHTVKKVMKISGHVSMHDKFCILFQYEFLRAYVHYMAVKARGAAK